MQSKRNQPNNKIFLPWILFIQSNLFLQRTCLFIHVFLNIKSEISTPFIYYILMFTQREREREDRRGCFFLFVNLNRCFEFGLLKGFSLFWIGVAEENKKKNEQATPNNTCFISYPSSLQSSPPHLCRVQLSSWWHNSSLSFEFTLCFYYPLGHHMHSRTWNKFVPSSSLSSRRMTTIQLHQS